MELQSLSLVSCGLTKIPENVFVLEKLKFLCLKDNFIKEIPSEICSLTVLEEFDISHNNLISIHESVRTLPLLIRVNISNNPYIRLSAIKDVLACEKLEKLIVSNFSVILPLLRTEDIRQRFIEVTNNAHEEVEG